MSKFASLTAGLLARKGEAEPASTPFADELLTRAGSPTIDIGALTPMSHAHAAKPRPASIFASFGRRIAQDFASPGEAERIEPPPPAPPMIEVVTPLDEEQQDNKCASCPGPSTDDTARTFHVNLRLKRARFVRLKLSAALLRMPVQDVVGEALDQWFDRLPRDVIGDCACLNARGD